MEFLRNLVARFTAKPAPTPASSLYSDAEFLEVVAELARQRARAERQASEPSKPAANQASQAIA